MNEHPTITAAGSVLSCRTYSFLATIQQAIINNIYEEQRIRHDHLDDPYKIVRIKVFIEVEE